MTLLLTALATLCLIAPVSHHRILFRRGRKKELVDASSTLAGVGLVFLWLSVVGAVFLVFEVVVARRGRSLSPSRSASPSSSSGTSSPPSSAENQALRAKR